MASVLTTGIVVLQERRSCYQCVYLHRAVESWEMSHIQWWECTNQRSQGKASLKSFPFSNTKCRDFEAITKIETTNTLLLPVFSIRKGDKGI